jgi:Cof subfamily protein (haloacid dehalogenase superfamily)
MEKYLITIDLDGTLMYSLSSYDEETFAYLRYLKSLGHKIVIATGRPFRSSYFVYQLLDLDTPLINYNGAYITNPTDPNYPITDIRVSRQELFNIIEILQDGLINIFCEIHDDIYVHNYNSEIRDFLHLDGGRMFAGELPKILTADPHGALVFVKDSHLHLLYEYVEHNRENQIEARHWKVNEFDIVEIYHPKVDKKEGMLQAANYYKIKPENIIAIGDGNNDIGMVETAYHGVAMGNARPMVKQVAKYQTAPIEEQGALKFLKKFFASIDKPK